MIFEGESVSYGHTWTAPADTTLALVPVGYADGVPRSLSYRGSEPMQETAIQAGVGFAGTIFGTDAGEGRFEPLGTGEIKELTVGDFTIPNATVVAVNVSGDVLHSKSEEESNSGLIGAEYLAWNFAVIDVGGMALYLRHADSR